MQEKKSVFLAPMTGATANGCAWQERVVSAGGNMIEDGVIANNAPDDEALAACKSLGEKAARE